MGINCFVSFGQQSVSGTIYNSKGIVISSCLVKIYRAADSVRHDETVSNDLGYFQFKNVNSGPYIISFNKLGYKKYTQNIYIENKAILLNSITLVEGEMELGAVEIKAQIPTVKQKGDTTEYHAGAFKTNPDATAEDLINKMPGISTQDGKVQAQGEEVKQVLIDGKQVFGDDANAVLKNLPAEVVDKIQIFDKKSDQAQFTGIDDGSASKTINIITKPQFRNGKFGKIYSGYGLDDKWKAGETFNLFKGKKRFTFLSNVNNVNDQNFSTEDLLGVVGNAGGNNGGARGGRGRGGRGQGTGGSGGGESGGNSDNFLVDQKTGITTTKALGINYTNEWKKVELTASYFLNSTNNIATTNLYRTYISKPNTGLLYDENSVVSAFNQNHRLNMRIEWKIDTLNSFVFQPKISLQKNKTSSSLSGENIYHELPLSSLFNGSLKSQSGYNISSPILYRHGYKKKGRTLSIQFAPSFNKNSGTSGLSSQIDYENDSSLNYQLDQHADNNKSGLNLKTNITYTEMLDSNRYLQFNVGNGYNQNTSNKYTYGYDQAKLSYSLFDTLLSNSLKNIYVSYSAGTSFRYQKNKLNSMVGINYQYAQLMITQNLPTENNMQRPFHSLLPTAMLMYKYSANKNLRINYNSANNAPSANQLQVVINNSNPLQLSTGNPYLKQDFSNALNIRYSAVNPKKNTSFFTLINGTYTKNYIGNSTVIAFSDTVINEHIYLPGGGQLTMPANMNGFAQFRSLINYSIPIKKIKCVFSFSGGYTFSSVPGLINGFTNKANQTSITLGAVLSSNISERIDFTVTSNSGYNIVLNTLQKQSNSIYFNQNTKFKIQAIIWKSFILQTDLNHQYYQGLSSRLTQNYLLWNAGIGYKFLKKKAGEFRLTVFDILKQNNSVSRNITETYYEDAQTNVLQRYYMLTFTYTLRQFKSKSN
jgi:hypothetical protein